MKSPSVTNRDKDTPKKEQVSGKQLNDPWPDMERDVDATTIELSALLQRLNEHIREQRNAITQHQLGARTTFSMEAGDEIVAELRRNMQQLEVDIHDLATTINVVEDHPDKFSLSVEEIHRRREVLQDFERRISRVRQGVDQAESERGRMKTVITAMTEAHRSGGGASGGDTETGEFSRGHLEQQQLERVRQDAALDRIQVGVHGLGQKAKLIGGELTDQEKLLADVDKNVTMVQAKLETAAKKLGVILDNSSDRTKFICIVVLTIILFLLIMLMFSGSDSK